MHMDARACATQVNRYNAILMKLGAAADDEWEAIVAVYRGDFQKPFFEHMQCLMAAAKVRGGRRPWWREGR